MRPSETAEQPASGPIGPPSIIPIGGPAGSTALFPDVTGMSARDALRTLARLGLSARLRGTGLVVGQQPAAGTPIDSRVTVLLRLERQPPTPITSAAKS
jgi:hypothetical protein